MEEPSGSNRYAQRSPCECTLLLARGANPEEDTDNEDQLRGAKCRSRRFLERLTQLLIRLNRLNPIHRVQQDAEHLFQPACDGIAQARSDILYCECGYPHVRQSLFAGCFTGNTCGAGGMTEQSASNHCSISSVRLTIKDMPKVSSTCACNEVRPASSASFPRELGSIWPRQTPSTRRVHPSAPTEPAMTPHVTNARQVPMHTEVKRTTCADRWPKRGHADHRHWACRAGISQRSSRGSFGDSPGVRMLR